MLYAVSQASFDKDCGGEEYSDESLSGGKGNDRLYGGYLIYLAGNRGREMVDGCNRLDYSGASFGSATGPVTVKLNKGSPEVRVTTRSGTSTTW